MFRIETIQITPFLCTECFKSVYFWFEAIAKPDDLCIGIDLFHLIDKFRVDDQHNLSRRMFNVHPVGNYLRHSPTSRGTRLLLLLTAASRPSFTARSKQRAPKRIEPTPRRQPAERPSFSSLSFRAGYANREQRFYAVLGRVWADGDRPAVPIRTIGTVCWVTTDH